MCVCGKQCLRIRILFFLDLLITVGNSACVHFNQMRLSRKVCFAWNNSYRRVTLENNKTGQLPKKFYFHSKHKIVKWVSISNCSHSQNKSKSSQKNGTFFFGVRTCGGTKKKQLIVVDAAKKKHSPIRWIVGLFHEIPSERVRMITMKGTTK